MNVILFDDYRWDNLLPLTFTRPVCELRIGILTVREKWENMLTIKCSFQTKEYLSKKYPVIRTNDNILINGSVLPNLSLVKKIESLKKGQVLGTANTIIAVRAEEAGEISGQPYFEDYEHVEFKDEFLQINYPWDIFRLNGESINTDFQVLSEAKKSVALSKTNTLLNPQGIFAEEGVRAESATINAGPGPVYLGKNSEVMEGSLIRGPFALCENSVVKMGAKIYGPTTVGPSSMAGGEIKNSVILGFSNKAHDGFLGNSVIGEWCNIGADTNNSNLKNTYGEVRMWNYKEEKFIGTGLIFCGLIMGDHSKCGINTMFNTGTVAGVFANIFGSGYQVNFIPSFSWGGPKEYSVYKPEKAFEVAKEVMSKKNIEFDEKEKEILKAVFEMTKKYRSYGVRHKQL